MAPLRPVWTPEDAANLRALAAEFPREIGESSVLDFIMTSEGL